MIAPQGMVVSARPCVAIRVSGSGWTKCGTIALYCSVSLGSHRTDRQTSGSGAQSSSASSPLFPMSLRMNLAIQ